VPIRARAIALLRRLRAAGALPPPKRQQGRWLPTRPPEALAQAYGDVLAAEVAIPAIAAFTEVEGEILALLRGERASMGHADAAGSWRGQIARQLIDRAAHNYSRRVLASGRRLHAQAHLFAERTREHSRQQLDQQLREAIGVPYTSIEKPIRDLVPVFTSSNAEIVKSIPDRYFERLRRDVSRAVEEGTHPETMAQRFRELDGMADTDARRLARDQILKLQSNITHARLESIGVREAIWRTMRDNRVCDECYAKAGQRFPIDEGIGGCRPGECHPEDRCYSEPILSFLA
jgi:SPP1 gp7 family putative phage head morphogenesis protein